MAIASKKRLHRNYCTIVIVESPLPTRAALLSLDCRVLHSVKYSSIEYLERRAHTTMDGNNTANKIKTLLFPFPPVLCAC